MKSTVWWPHKWTQPWRTKLKKEKKKRQRQGHDGYFFKSCVHTFMIYDWLVNRGPLKQTSHTQNTCITNGNHWRRKRKQTKVFDGTAIRLSSSVIIKKLSMISTSVSRPKHRVPKIIVNIWCRTASQTTHFSFHHTKLTLPLSRTTRAMLRCERNPLCAKRYFKMWSWWRTLLQFAHFSPDPISSCICPI